MTRFTEQAERLLEQIAQQFEFEEGMGIDHDDNDRFSARELLEVAEGWTTIEALVWGQAPEHTPEADKARLDAWNEWAAKAK